jgi:hypothetical protein
MTMSQGRTNAMLENPNSSSDNTASSRDLINHAIKREIEKTVASPSNRSGQFGFLGRNRMFIKPRLKAIETDRPPAAENNANQISA